MTRSRSRVRVGSGSRLGRPGLTPAVDSTGRRFRLVLQVAILIVALAVILYYGGIFGDRAAGCFTSFGVGAKDGSVTARFSADDAALTR